jgi:isopenicillin-N epimerase
MATITTRKVFSTAELRPMKLKPFGHPRLSEFLLAPNIDHLNHGGFGATPRVVLMEAQRWREKMEADPSIFFHRDLPMLLRQAAVRVAALLGGVGTDWAFVENATIGMNAIVASLTFGSEDEILCLSQIYDAVANVLRHHCQRRGAQIVVVRVPMPFDCPDTLLRRLVSAITPRTRLAVFDHITSACGAVLPIKEMAAICRDRGVPVVVDGAHAPGQLSLDVSQLGVDWYVGNLHKWAFAPKGTGVIWCAPERQPSLHPTAISHYLDQGFTAEFDYCGTRDNSAWLAVPAAVDYLDSLNPEAVCAYNNALAEEGGTLLASEWGTEIAASSAFRAAMASVRLPGSTGASSDVARRISIRLKEEHSITAAAMLLEGNIWIRVSAQIYNEISDY